MSSSARVAVRIHGADKVYPNGVRALVPVDLEIAQGEFVTLLGPSGCGKSTLLRMVAGLSAPSRGAVTLWPDDPSFRRTPESTKDDHPIAFVFQQPTLMPWASLERNVRLPLDLAGAGGAAASRTVREALKLVGLSDFAGAYPRQLSGGMQMRASIARALVTDPRLMLMDEPFGALDEITRNRLDHDVRELWARRGLTVMFVTHSIYEAVFLSTRVLVMSPRPGRIVGALHIDPAQPRDEAFRLSTRFAQWCRQLSGMLDSANRASAQA
jgi:NitT/TauT family transport system ATP-binding protein